MADPRDTPLSTVWSVETPDNASMISVGQTVVARCAANVVAVDHTGRMLWQTDLGDGAGEGAVLLSSSGTIVTDTRTGPKKTTTLVGVRDGKVAYSTTLDCLVANQGATLLGDEVYVVGTAAKGTVLRSMRIADGTRRLDLVRRGRDVTAAADRLVVLDSFGEPGVVSIDSSGRDERILAQQSAQEMALAGRNLLTALRTGLAPRRTAQMLDVGSGQPLWAHPCHGASIGLDDELALHVELDGGKPCAVARDARSGQLRWRSESPLGDDMGIFRFAGSFVAFTHGTGTTIYRRDNGSLVAELVAVYALAAHERFLYLEGSQRIACVDGAA